MAGTMGTKMETRGFGARREGVEGVAAVRSGPGRRGRDTRAPTVAEGPGWGPRTGTGTTGTGTGTEKDGDDDGNGEDEDAGEGEGEESREEDEQIGVDAGDERVPGAFVPRDAVVVRNILREMVRASRSRANATAFTKTFVFSRVRSRSNAFD